MSSTTGFRSRERPHSPPTDAEARRAMERRRAPDAANPLMTAPMRKANYPTAKPTGWDTRSAWRAPGGPARIAGEMLRTEARAEAAGGPARLFADFTWTTRDSSSRARRGSPRPNGPMATPARHVRRPRLGPDHVPTGCACGSRRWPVRRSTPSAASALAQTRIAAAAAQSGSSQPFPSATQKQPRAKSPPRGHAPARPDDTRQTMLPRLATPPPLVRNAGRRSPMHGQGYNPPRRRPRRSRHPRRPGRSGPAEQRGPPRPGGGPPAPDVGRRRLLSPPPDRAGSASHGPNSAPGACELPCAAWRCRTRRIPGGAAAWPTPGVADAIRPAR